MAVLSHPCSVNQSAAAEPQEVIVPRSQQLQIVQSATQRPFRIYINVPSEPPRSSKGYATVYVLDGNSTFLPAAASWSLQATGSNDLEAALIVAIGYDGDENTIRRLRYFDLTPAPDNEIVQRLNDSSLKLFGGADAFLDFMESDVKSYLQSHYPVDVTRQAIVGHSLSGLLVLYALLTRPMAYSAYVAGSPSIWWNRSLMFEYANDRKRRRSTTEAPKRILIAVGADEAETMRADASKFADALTNNLRPREQICFSELAGEDHMSMILATINRSVRFILQGSACTKK